MIVSRNFNSQINAIRRRNNVGVYDIHTNIVQYPTIMQPTSARIEQVAPNADGGDEATASQTFPVLSPSIPRNFLVTDTYCETPPAGVSSVSYERHASVLANADHTSSDFLAPFRGLDAVGDDVKDCLPPECREAFEQALTRERSWHAVRFPLPPLCCANIFSGQQC